jgi:hypothetical protein
MRRKVRRCHAWARGIARFSTLATTSTIPRIGNADFLRISGEFSRRDYAGTGITNQQKKIREDSLSFSREFASKSVVGFEASAALPRTPRRFGRGSSRKQYEFSGMTSWGYIEKPPVSTPGASHSFGCRPYDASRRRSSGTFERKFRDSVSCSPPLVTSVKSPVRRECSSRITSRFTIIDR